MSERVINVMIMAKGNKINRKGIKNGELNKDK